MVIDNQTLFLILELQNIIALSWYYTYKNRVLR